MTRLSDVQKSAIVLAKQRHTGPEVVALAAAGRLRDGAGNPIPPFEVRGPDAVRDIVRKARQREQRTGKIEQPVLVTHAIDEEGLTPLAGTILAAHRATVEQWELNEADRKTNEEEARARRDRIALDHEADARAARISVAAQAAGVPDPAEAIRDLADRNGHQLGH